MSHRAAAATAAVVMLACLAAGCDRVPREARVVEEGRTAAQLADAEAPFPGLRFADGSASINDRCPVRKVKLNPRLPPLYVNGKPIGFC